VADQHAALGEPAGLLLSLPSCPATGGFLLFPQELARCAVQEASLGRPDSQAHALTGLAKELFELIENECDRSEECAAFVSFFAKARCTHTWQASLQVLLTSASIHPLLMACKALQIIQS
jgi:hypothetical protein